MYRYERRESKLKKIIGMILLIVSVSVISIYLYNMYININVKSEPKNSESAGTAIRLSAETEGKQEISNTLEDTTKCVVGISKIKNKGDSIFESGATRKFKFRHRNNNFR